MKALDWKKSEAPFLYNQEKEIYQKEYGSYFRVKQINIMHWRRQGKRVSPLWRYCSAHFWLLGKP